MYAGLIRDWPKRVCFGPGSVAQLPRLMADLGAERAMVACGKSVAGGEMLVKIRAALGEKLAGVFADIPAHTPYECMSACKRRPRSSNRSARPGQHRRRQQARARATLLS